MNDSNDSLIVGINYVLRRRVYNYVCIGQSLNISNK